MKCGLIFSPLLLMACTEPIGNFNSIEDPFVKDIWQTNISIRGAMLKDFLTKNDVTKQDRASIELLLGNPDGYYLYDEFPAYRLKEKGTVLLLSLLIEIREKSKRW